MKPVFSFYDVISHITCEHYVLVVFIHYMLFAYLHCIYKGVTFFVDEVSSCFSVQFIVASSNKHTVFYVGHEALIVHLVTEELFKVLSAVCRMLDLYLAVIDLGVYSA